MSKKTKFLKIAAPFIVILLGAGIMAALVSRRPEPKKEVKKVPGVLVQVIRVKREDKEVIIKGTGTVQAAQEVSVAPQISGRVTYAAPDMVVGGFFKKGDLLFQIEDTDYKLALDRAYAVRASAEYELATVESRARIARTEWERINKDGRTPPNPLVLFEPQLKNAGAALASASAAVEQARLDLERTKVKAPFNGLVRSENIDSGQYIKSGNSVAVLAGTDTAEIVVPLPLDDLRWLNIPIHGVQSNGPVATARVSIGGKHHEWQGRVIRSTGEVDPRTRMMRLVVGINDPYGLHEKKAPPGPSLAIGTFVGVMIKGRSLKDVFVIPRTAFRDDSSVWLMDSENKLRIKKVVPVRIEQDKVIIREGLVEGDMIVLTNISGAADGMKLRPIK